MHSTRMQEDLKGSDGWTPPKQGHRLTHMGSPRSSGKSATNQGAGVRVPCAKPERSAYASPHSLPTRRGDTHKAAETASSGRVVTGEPARKRWSLRIFYSVCSVHREQILILLQPSPQLCPSSRARAKEGWGREEEDGAARPGTTPWPSHFASFCPSFPTCKMGRLFTSLPWAGQHLMSIRKALPDP